MNLAFSTLLLFSLFSFAIFAQQAPRYDRFEGKLGPRDVVLEWMSWPESTNDAEQEVTPIVAYYYFKDEGIPILLYKSSESKNGNIVLHAWSDDIEERFEITQHDKTLVGRWFWTATDEGEAINLKAKQLVGKDNFTFHRIFKEVEQKLNSSKDVLTGTVSFSAFLPQNSTLQQSFISFATNNSYHDFESYSTEEISSFENDYKEFVQESIQYGDTEFSPSMNHFFINRICPVMNSDQYLIMLQSTYSYSGGAHGMNTTYYYNYDKIADKWLQLEDILDLTKIASIENVLDTELRRQYNIPKGVKLSEDKRRIFIADEIHLIDNFTLSNDQITFHYQPYALTPYATGPFALSIPLEKFKEMMANDRPK